MWVIHGCCIFVNFAGYFERVDSVCHAVAAYFHF